MPVSLTSSIVGVFPCSMSPTERHRGCAARDEGTTTSLLGAGNVTAVVLDHSNDFLHHPPHFQHPSLPGSVLLQQLLRPHVGSTAAASRIWNKAWQCWCQEGSKGSFEVLSSTLPYFHTQTASRAGEMVELLLCRNSETLRMWAQRYSHH